MKLIDLCMYSSVGIAIIIVWVTVGLSGTRTAERDLACRRACEPFQVQTCEGGSLDKEPSVVWCLTAAGMSERKK